MWKMGRGKRLTEHIGATHDRARIGFDSAESAEQTLLLLDSALELQMGY